MSDFERVAARLRLVSPAVRAALPDAARAGVMVVKPVAIANARTIAISGELADSIRDEAGESGFNHARHDLIVGAFYAAWVEYGRPRSSTGPAAANPYLRPAVDMMGDEAKRTAERHAKRAIERALGVR